jgi:hypothetical protein
VRFDFRGGAGEGELYRQYATEVVALAPDVIFTNASATVTALQQVTRTLPIVFATVIDPVGALSSIPTGPAAWIAANYRCPRRWRDPAAPRPASHPAQSP